jgi:putative phosphoesterase
MVRIVAVSDTHQDIAGAREAIRREAPVAMVLHAGDLPSDATALRNAFPEIPVHGVNGNNSPLPDAEDILTVETPFGRILLTHGHLWPVAGRLERMAGIAKARGARWVVYGHTHVQEDRTVDGVRMLNPGTCRPRAGRGPTYTVFEWDGSADGPAIVEKELVRGE